MDWNKLYDLAKGKLNPRKISPFIDAGSVSAAILTESGNVYTGVCIDTACTLGMCAERNAIANMITNGESKIVKLVCVMKSGDIGLPCGACREYLMQLDKNSPNIQILVSRNPEKIVLLKDLIPYWWGEEDFNEISDI